MDRRTRLRSKSFPPKIKEIELGTLCFDLLVKYKKNKAISPISEFNRLILNFLCFVFLKVTTIQIF